jgi:hypothetical protein
MAVVWNCREDGHGVRTAPPKRPTAGGRQWKSAQQRHKHSVEHRYLGSALELLHRTASEFSRCGFCQIFTGADRGDDFLKQNL